MLLTLGAKALHQTHSEFCIDGWNVKTVESIKTGELDWEDTLMEDTNEISHINTEKYLGQILSNDSKNTFNITMLRNKGVGLKKKKTFKC